MSREERAEFARKAAKTRWERMQNQQDTDQVSIEDAREDLPVARYPGTLRIMAGIEVPVYVLSNEQRVIARIAATEVLTGIKRQGDLESYIGASFLKPFLDFEAAVKRMVTFRLADVEMVNSATKGLPSDLFIEICQSYMHALRASLDPSGVKMTARQREVAIRAGSFVSACAKVGLDALIDEATGYQYERPVDEMELKLRLYLEDSMRDWEKTFPDQLWKEFGRLTNWKGSINSRPKYWGKLIMELIYGYLDPDVAQWLKDNAPKPMHGQNYHQWMSGQFGLKKLIEHIWMVIGVASMCTSMDQLRREMQEKYGNKPGFQFELKLSTK